jgi:hypothetical protein
MDLESRPPEATRRFRELYLDGRRRAAGLRAASVAILIGGCGKKINEFSFFEGGGGTYLKVPGRGVIKTRCWEWQGRWSEYSQNI